MDGYDDRAEWTPEELKAEFATLFPHGWAGPDVMAELAPGGWAASPLIPLLHPSAEQLFQETLTVHRNMALLRRPAGPPPEPTRDQFPDDDAPPEVEPERECRELVGRCLWDVFSDAHEVISDDGRVLSPGSSRGSGGCLADVLNAQGGPPPPRPEIPADLTAAMFPPTDDPQMAAFLAEMRKEMFGDGGYTYLDFYMGTGMVSGRADLVPVYALIFRRLRARGHDWGYHFPRLYAVDFRPLKKALDEQERGGEPEFAGYDPSAAFEAEAEDRRTDEELAEFRERLGEGHREAVEAARGMEPPATVRAYAAVYGHWPTGWPPEA